MGSYEKQTVWSSWKSAARAESRCSPAQRCTVLLPQPKQRRPIAEQSPHWQEVALARTMIVDGAIGQPFRLPLIITRVHARQCQDPGVFDLIQVARLAGGGLLKRAGGEVAIDGGLH
jgi:hypothetical protein